VERPTVGPTSPERNPDGLCRGHTCRSPAGCARDAGAAAPAALLPSPDSWQDEVVYFLLVDRFRDGAESTRPLLDRTKLTDARPDQANGEPWRWDHWAFSGSDRYLLGAARTGELFGWSRILVDEEALCVVNPNGIAARGAGVVVDSQLSPPGSTLTVIMNSAQAGGPAGAAHSVGSQVPVRRAGSGAAYAEIRDVGPSEVLVLVNRP
jgi:hypothetical protein